MIDGALRLSVRPPTGGRGSGVVFGLVLVGFGAVFAAVGWTLARPEYVAVCRLAPGHRFLPAADCVRHSFWYEYLDPSQLIALVGVPFVLAGAVLAVSALRSGVWLAGATLVVRGLRTRAVNLSTATVAITVGPVPVARPAVHGRIIELTARNDTGRPIRLTWHAEQMPGTEPQRLAAAIAESRPVTDADAHRVAALLRAMAAETHPLPAR